MIQTKDLKKVEEEYNLINIEGFSAFCFKYPENGYPRYFAVFGKDASPGVVAHEAAHVVNMIFDDHLIKLDINNDEPQCYLLEWVVNQIHQNIDIKI